MESISKTVTAFNQAMTDNILRFETMKPDILKALEAGAIEEDTKKEFLDLITEINLGAVYIQNALKAAVIVEQEVAKFHNKLAPQE